MPTFELAAYDNLLTRAQFAKIITQFARVILKKELNTGAKCDFNDLETIDSPELQGFMMQSCQLGIMGVNG